MTHVDSQQRSPRIRSLSFERHDGSSTITRTLRRRQVRRRRWLALLVVVVSVCIISGAILTSSGSSRVESSRDFRRAVATSYHSVLGSFRSMASALTTCTTSGCVASVSWSTARVIHNEAHTFETHHTCPSAVVSDCARYRNDLAVFDFELRAMALQSTIGAQRTYLAVHIFPTFASLDADVTVLEQALARSTT